MSNLLSEISTLHQNEINDVLQKLLHRYRELFPGWDIWMITIDKQSDQKRQIDEIIVFLEKYKSNM